jgi:hypothetical protein
MASDPRNCGSCGNDCVAKAVHALVACVAGACVTTGCESGYHDLDDDGACEYGCVASGPEQCDGLDNDCDGLVDEGVVPPSPTKACGVSLAATRSECTSAVTVSCVAGSWSCSFPAGVCGPSCASAVEVCDGLDNDCDGLVNEGSASRARATTVSQLLGTAHAEPLGARCAMVLTRFVAARRRPTARRSRVDARSVATGSTTIATVSTTIATVSSTRLRSSEARTPRTSSGRRSPRSGSGASCFGSRRAARRPLPRARGLEMAMRAVAPNVLHGCPRRRAA